MLDGFAPVYDLSARVLILGSFPGVASLAQGQYYAHPQNQFWPIIASLIDGRDHAERLLGLPYAQRLARARAAGIAIWDVHGQCERDGSLDAAIRQARPNDLLELVGRLPELQAIAFNGKAAFRQARLFDGLGLTLLALPSTSPAYAMIRFDQKLVAWQALERYLRK